MSESEFRQRQHILREDELEQVLRDFFNGEIPKELSAGTSPCGQPPAGVEARQKRFGRRTAGLVAATIAAAGFLFTVSLARHRSDAIPNGPIVVEVPRQSNTDQPVAVVDQAQPIDALEMEAPVPLDVAMFDRTEPLDRQIYDTADGPVEQRTDLVWTDVSYCEPQSGANVQWSLPAIKIEVFPLSK